MDWDTEELEGLAEGRLPMGDAMEGLWEQRGVSRALRAPRLPRAAAACNAVLMRASTCKGMGGGS